ncbi:MAG TPA: GNAT family protein [Fibrobacteraceae bacterium]|nr:GNAT family protein [Fibrobacteraceae bacterium]
MTIEQEEPDFLPELHGPRIHLRPLEGKDASLFFEVVHADKTALGQWLPWVEGMISPKHAASFLAAAEIQQEMGNGGIWGVFLRKHLIGAVTLHWIQWEHMAASLGYWLCHSSQGQGLATEACQLALRHCFVQLGLNRVELSVATDNQPSLTLARRLGLREEGLRRQYERLHGVFHDHISFAMLAEDYLLLA